MAKKNFGFLLKKFGEIDHAVPEGVEIKKNDLSENSNGFDTPRDPRGRVDRPVNPKNSETFYFIQLSDWLAETGRNYYIQSKNAQYLEFPNFLDLPTYLPIIRGA